MKGVFPRLRGRMASGLVVLIPVVVTLLVLRLVFGFTAGILLPIVDPAVEDWPLWLRSGLSLVILLVVVYVLGELATNFIGRRVLGFGEAVLLRVPFVKVIYLASKQVVSAFQRSKAQAFKSVVLLEFPTPGMHAVGFVTGNLPQPDGSTWSTVFVPTTPNPTTGFLQVLPRERLRTTTLTVEEGIKLVMSLGVLAPGGLLAAIPSGALPPEVGDAGGA